MPEQLHGRAEVRQREHARVLAGLAAVQQLDASIPDPCRQGAPAVGALTSCESGAIVLIRYHPGLRGRELMDIAATDLMSYAGVITGGLALVVSFLGYRRTNAIKSLDLRIELRRAVVDLHRDTAMTRARMEQAELSRKAVASATGSISRLKLFLAEFAHDRAAAGAVAAQTPGTAERFTDLSQTELEDKLIMIHGLQMEIRNLADKYLSALAADDDERRRIMEAHNARRSKPQ